MSATMVDPATRAEPARSGSAPEVRKVPFTARLRRDYPLLVMVAPAVVLLLLFVYVPLLGNVIAFMDYQPYIPISQSPWVGVQNFAVMFADADFWRATINTLEITFIQLVLFFPVPIALALLIHSLVWPWLRATVQSVLYLPHFLSWVIVVGFFQQSLGSGGVLNHALRQLDVGTVGIMSDPATFKLLLTSQVIWKDAGWGTIIFLAALAAIDDNLYEAAAIDGAGAWSRFWHVTLPGSGPSSSCCSSCGSVRRCPWGSSRSSCSGTPWGPMRPKCSTRTSTTTGSSTGTGPPASPSAW